MEKYFSVGEAAKAAHTTSETLRHYDRIGLVKPSKKDEWTNYRYYTEQDIVRLNTVRALQVMELGLLFMLAAFLVFTAVSALGGRLAHWFNSSPRGQMLMHRVAGLVFVALAVMLIFSCVA